MEQKKLTAQIAAAYFGCQVTDGYFTGTMIEIRNDTVTLQKNGATAGLSISECQLILTPPSKITDKDAIDVARIYFGESFLAETNGLELKFLLRNGKKLSQNIKYNFLVGCTWIQLTDYLRSKYYDCGYGSISSLIEAGIAVDKSKIK